MLHPKDSAQYDGVINDVVAAFVKRIYFLRRGSPTGDLVTDVANEFYHFSLEGMKRRLVHGACSFKSCIKPVCRALLMN